jgi:hypothetical protein
VKIVGLADSDSYVKWGAALLGTLPPEWERELLVVDSQFTVNDTQLRDAIAGTGVTEVARTAFADVSARVAERAPDVVLVAAPGPVSRELVRLIARLEPRPVIVSGMPGISIPVTVKALRFRRQSDLMIVHSRREVREFATLARERGWDHRLGLARLPFASARPPSTLGPDLVFAAQAIVPRERADRIVVARMLRDAALADPSRRVVVKLRARPGERSTHPEQDGYPELLEALGDLPPNLVFASGPMGEALDAAAGLVTVSSTAILEAVARGIPTIAIDTFGISDGLINPVFTGSGMFGGRDDVVERRFRHPEPAWLDDNYFHAEDDWVTTLDALVAARRRGELPARAPHVQTGGRLRAAWDRRQALGASDRSLAGRVALVIGVPARGVLRIARRVSARRSLRATAG